MRASPPRRLRLPGRFAFTAFHVAVAGTLACTSDGARVMPASTDAAADVADSSAADGSGRGDGALADAGGDSLADAPDTRTEDVVVADGQGEGGSDAADDCAANYYCGPASPDASCPGPVCDLSLCDFDAGCEPFV